MKSIKSIITKLESDFQVNEYKENGKLCGYELNTFTDGGVNQTVFLDFRDADLNPKNVDDFLKVYNERVNDIDIDDEITMNRQDDSYCNVFSLSESVKDFKNWKDNLVNMFSKKSSQVRQMEQTIDKFKSLISQLEEVIELMPTKGCTSNECQKMNILNDICALDRSVNGIELEDFTPNEYSENWQLSYS